MARDTDLTFATQDLTFTGNATNGQTIVIGDRTYTTQTALTNSDGNVQISSDAPRPTEGTIDNLVAAINGAAGAGTAYAAATTRNEHVWAVKVQPEDPGVEATVLRVYAAVPGAIGNNIATTETQTNASWGGETLVGGMGAILQYLQGVLRMTNMNGEIAAELHYMMPDR